MVASLYAQSKEVLIMGTMHTVPKVVKNSYKPLLKAAIEYAPDAIYVERPRSTDTISLNNVYSKFLAKGDSLNTHIGLDQSKFKQLMSKPLEEMTRSEFEYLEITFCIQHDYANYEYYHYLKEYGIEGSPKPLRNENGDLTTKLAIHQGMKVIYSMDDQQEREEYHQAWKTCAHEGHENGNQLIKEKLLKKLYRREVSKAVTGRLGYAANNVEAIEEMHALNSFEYVKTATEACTLGNQYWDNRNGRMVKNTVDQVRALPHQRNLIVVGAGHVYGMKEYFEQQYPDIKVRLLTDL